VASATVFFETKSPSRLFCYWAEDIIIINCAVCRILWRSCTRIPGESSVCRSRRTRTLKWTWMKSGWFQRRPSTVGPSGLRLLVIMFVDVFVKWFYVARLPTSTGRLAATLPHYLNTGITS